MADEQPILTERRGEKNGILWITLNRPERLNALTFPLLQEFREILFEARFDRTIRCIVITGSGRGFCAGMDFSGSANPDPDPIPPGLTPDQPCLLYTSPSPRDGLLARMPSSA